MGWTMRNGLLPVYWIGLSFLGFGLFFVHGFYPLDATHTRLSTLRCYHEVLGDGCKAEVADLRFWKTPLPAISFYYEERNTSYTVCGCNERIAETTCAEGQAMWMTHSRPDETPDADSCSSAPICYLVFGVVLSSCAVILLTAYTRATCKSVRNEHRDALMRVRLLDPNNPTGDQNAELHDDSTCVEKALRITVLYL